MGLVLLLLLVAGLALWKREKGVEVIPGEGAYFRSVREQLQRQQGA